MMSDEEAQRFWAYQGIIGQLRVMLGEAHLVPSNDAITHGIAVQKAGVIGGMIDSLVAKAEALRNEEQRRERGGSQ